MATVEKLYIVSTVQGGLVVIELQVFGFAGRQHEFVTVGCFLGSEGCL